MSDKLIQDAYHRNLLHAFNLPTNPRDPNYSTIKDEKVDLEVEDMLCRDRIHEVVNANIDDVSRIVANHRYDMLDLGENIMAYFREKAKESIE